MPSANKTSGVKVEQRIITPEMADKLLTHNRNNRPISDQHVRRITEQILAGKWKMNGDTIKISDTKNVLDGQHRLWAIVYAKMPVESLVVEGIPEDSFDTMDTIRRGRTGADVIALQGASIGRGTIAGAIMWLLRIQRGTVPDYRRPENRIENSDIRSAFLTHGKGLERARERTSRLTGLGSKPLLTAMFYWLTNRDAFLAERMVATLENPSKTSLNDPFFRLREYFVGRRDANMDPLVTIAVIIKAANLAKRGEECKMLRWQGQGNHPEAFPVLDI